MKTYRARSRRFDGFPRDRCGGLSAAVLALLALVALPVTAAESTATRIDFIAHDETPGSTSIAPCRIGMQVGAIRASMHEIDRHAAWISSTNLARVPAMGEVVDGAVQFDCALDDDWRIGLAWRAGRSDTKGGIADHRFSIGANFSGGELVLARQLLRSRDGISLDALLALGRYRSSYREAEGDWTLRGTDHASGLRIGIEASWRASESMAFFVRAERVWLKFDDYRDAGATISFVSPGAPRVTADFGGPSIGAGVRWFLR